MVDACGRRKAAYRCRFNQDTESDSSEHHFSSTSVLDGLYQVAASTPYPTLSLESNCTGDKAENENLCEELQCFRGICAG